MYVHNLSAVGEQYLDFEPPDDEGPYAENGDTLKGERGVDARWTRPTCSSSSTQFVSSVDRRNLKVVIRELGLMFNDTGRALQQMLDQGSRFIDEAAAHEEETIAASRQRADRPAHPARRGREHPLVRARPATCSPGAAPERRRPARSAAGHPRHRPGAGSDAGRPRAHPAGAARQRRQRQPGRGLPPRRARAAAGDLPARHRQRLHRDSVRRAAAGSTCSSPTRCSPAPRATCRRASGGAADQTERRPDLPGQCESPARLTTCAGTKYVPGQPEQLLTGPRVPWFVRPRAPAWWQGAVDAQGNPVRFLDPGNLSILGGDSWKWLLVGPVAGQ